MQHQVQVKPLDTDTLSYSAYVFPYIFRNIR